MESPHIQKALKPHRGGKTKQNKQQKLGISRSIQQERVGVSTQGSFGNGLKKKKSPICTRRWDELQDIFKQKEPSAKTMLILFERVSIHTLA